MTPGRLLVLGSLGRESTVWNEYTETLLRSRGNALHLQALVRYAYENAAHGISPRSRPLRRST